MSMPEITVAIRPSRRPEIVAGCTIVAICLAMLAYWVVRDRSALATAQTECAQEGRSPARLGTRFVCVDADRRIYLPH